MCGRFIISYTYNDLLKFMSSSFDIFDLDSNIEVPNYNVAPGTKVLSIISDGEKYRAGSLDWGFIPSFAKDIKSSYKMINARIEGIETKTAFKDSFVNKRCLILASGYYEWKKIGKSTQPFLIQKPNKEMFFFPGIWSKYTSNNNEVIYSTSIITTEANHELVEIHSRMPIIFNEKQAKEWLNPELKDSTKLLQLLEDNDNKDVVNMRVSEYVNNVKNNSKKCIEEYSDYSLF